MRLELSNFSLYEAFDQLPWKPIMTAPSSPILNQSSLPAPNNQRITPKMHHQPNTNKQTNAPKTQEINETYQVLLYSSQSDRPLSYSTKDTDHQL